MGSGVAGAIRKRWPMVYDQFKKQGRGKQMLGTADPVYISQEIIVVNCYTQLWYGFGGGRYADLKAVETSVSYAAKIANLYNFPLYLPRIGCGLGGLKWEEVEPVLERLALMYEGYIPIVICDPPGER